MDTLISVWNILVHVCINPAFYFVNDPGWSFISLLFLLLLFFVMWIVSWNISLCFSAENMYIFANINYLREYTFENQEWLWETLYITSSENFEHLLFNVHLSRTTQASGILSPSTRIRSHDFRVSSRAWGPLESPGWFLSLSFFSSFRHAFYAGGMPMYVCENLNISCFSVFMF